MLPHDFILSSNTYGHRMPSQPRFVTQRGADSSYCRKTERSWLTRLAKNEKSAILVWMLEVWRENCGRMRTPADTCQRLIPN